MVNSQGGVYGRKLVLADERDDKLANNSAEVKGLIEQDDVFAVLPIADAALHRRRPAGRPRASRPSAGPSTPSGRAPRRTPRPTSSARPAPTSASAASSPPSPTWPSRRTGRKIGLLAYAVPQSSECVEGWDKSFDQVRRRGRRRGRVQGRVARLRHHRPLGAGVQDEGRRGGHGGHLHRHQRRGDPGQGDRRSSRSTPSSTCPTPTTRNCSTSTATSSRAPTCTPPSPRCETDPKPDGLKAYEEWMDKTGGEVSENSLVGWLNADLFVNGPAGRRARLQPPEGHRRHQPDDRLHGRRPAVRRRLDQGPHPAGRRQLLRHPQDRGQRVRAADRSGRQDLRLLRHRRAEPSSPSFR